MGKDLENGVATTKAGRSVPAAPLLFSCRLTLFVVCMVATFSFMFQRININFALVCMVKSAHNILPPVDFTKLNSSVLAFQDNNNINSNASVQQGSFHSLVVDDADSNHDDNLDALANEQECGLISSTVSRSNKSQQYDQGEFEWSKEVQGALLASFYYGFVFTQIPGGFVCDRFGAKKAFLSTSLVFSFLSLLNPVAARLGPEYLFVTRLLMGLANGGSIPSINVLSARWCGAKERAFLLGIAYAGFSIASACTYPIAAFLCEYAGWSAIFYVAGTFGVLFCIGGYFLIFEWPEKHPRIQITELQYLRKNRAVEYGESKKKKLDVPWRKILLSPAILALLVTNFCCFWSFLTIVTYLPTFLKEVLHLDISQNGFYSSIPFITMLVFHFAAGKIFDTARKQEFCKLTNLRKIFNTGGMMVPAVCLVGIGFLSCQNHSMAVFLIAVASGFIEFAFMGGYLFSVFEMAPRFAGVVTGISNTFGLLTGFLCPSVVGYLTKDGTRDQWLHVFYVAAAFNVLGGLVYLIFGSCELQAWAAAPPPNKGDTELKLLKENLLNNSDCFKKNSKITNSNLVRSED